MRILAETGVAPGSSLILDGKVRSGTLHLALGAAARALLGPLGAGLVAANSYSRSVRGRNLFELVHFGSRSDKG